MSFLDDYIGSLEARIVAEREWVAPLQDGTMKLGTCPSGSYEWIDITQQHIDQSLQTIATYERLLTKAKADRAAQP